MTRQFALRVVTLGSLALVACSGDDSTAFLGADASGDGARESSVHADATPGLDSGTDADEVADVTVSETGPTEDGGADAESDAADALADSAAPDADAASDAADATSDAPADAPADAPRDVVTTDAAGDATADAGPSDAASDAAADAPVDATLTDAGADAPSDAAADAPGFDGGVCPLIWFAPPTGVPDTLAVPDGGGSVLLHARVEGGDQDYVCSVVNTDAGATLGWTRVGPDATLLDCLGNTIGTHFPSAVFPVDGGPAAPEWRTTDGHGVIASQVAASTPDGGQSSVPWLLLHAIAHDGPDASTGVLDRVGYIQRVNTINGLPPASNCTRVGDTFSSRYSAEYYFYGN